MLNSALALAARGLSIFPCLPRDKTPAISGGCNSATRDPDQIRAWWKLNPDFNIAIATGDKSGVFVADVDAAAGFVALARLGVLPDTVEANTARGAHEYFRMPKMDIRNSAGKVAPHVDIRGNGGYVLAPPSIHPSGQRYEWSIDCARSVADAPQWLLDKLVDHPSQKLRSDPGELVTDAVEGQRNDRIARLAGHLLRHRVHIQMTASLMLAWNAQHCIPPLDDDEVLRTIDSISKCEGRRRGH
jgi:hypothetical protein